MAPREPGPLPDRPPGARGAAPRWGTLLLAAAAGCSSYPMEPVWRAYEAGNLEDAYQKVLELQEENPRNTHVYGLEKAILELGLGRPQAAVDSLRRARDRLDELAGTGFDEWFSATLLDDNVIPYSGAPFEHVLVRAMLATADLMLGGADAVAYCLQVAERQAEIRRRLEEEIKHPVPDSHQLVAFGSYLRGIIDEDRVRLDAARQSYERVKELEPGFRDADANLERVVSGTISAKGNGVVQVIALVGRGPHRVESNEPVSQVAFAIAQLIWAHQRDRVTFPNIASVPIPALAFRPDNPSEVHVLVDGAPHGTTAVITDVEQTALEEFESIKDLVIARAVLRRAVKVTATEAAKEVNRQKNEWIDLGISLAGLLWSAAESADLRCWSLLPASIQVTRLELPAGDHRIELRAGRGGAAVGTPQQIQVAVQDGYNTYVVCLVPTLSGGPPPLASLLAAP